MSLLSPTLEAFWAVMQKGTVQEASKILGITQTGVTQRIRSLEKQLKITLFLRSRTGMKLTPEAEVLLQYVQLSKENEGMTLSRLQKPSFESNIELGISGPSRILQSRVIPKLFSLSQKFQNIKLNMIDCSYGDSLKRLKDGSSTFAFLSPEQSTRELKTKIIKPQVYRLYASKNLKLKKDFLSQCPLIIDSTHLQLFESFISNNKIKLLKNQKTHLSNELLMTQHLVKQGLGFSFLSEDFVKSNPTKDLINVLPNSYIEEKMILGWYHRSKMPDYFKAMIESIT